MEDGAGQSTSIHRPDHHDSGVYRIQHVLSHRSPHADDDNLLCLFIMPTLIDVF